MSQVHYPNGSKAFETLTEQTIHTPEQHWLHKFLGYDFILEKKPGKENIVDVPSRSLNFALSAPHSDLIADITKVVQNDAYWADFKNNCSGGNPVDSASSVRNEMLFWKNRLVVPPNTELIQHILQGFHSSPLGGPAGVNRTKARISSQFFWPPMANNIKDFVSKCLICQQAKASNALPAGLSQPLPIPTQIWEDLSIDFITSLPSSNSLKVILIVVYRLSKYSHFPLVEGLFYNF